MFYCFFCGVCVRRPGCCLFYPWRIDHGWGIGRVAAWLGGEDLCPGLVNYFRHEIVRIWTCGCVISVVVLLTEGGNVASVVERPRSGAVFQEMPLRWCRHTLVGVAGDQPDLFKAGNRRI